MARWITQTLSINEMIDVVLMHDSVKIGDPCDKGPAWFQPQNRAEANQMSVALKMAAKRLEDIGKSLS